MKRTYIITIDIDRDSVLTDKDIKDNIEGTLESRFDEINLDKWGHKLITEVDVKELNKTFLIQSSKESINIPSKVICVGGQFKEYNLHIFKVIDRVGMSIKIYNDIIDDDQILTESQLDDYVELKDFNTILKVATKVNIDSMKLLAAVIYDCQLNEVTNDMRQLAKANSFIEVYGGDPKSLKDML